MRSERWGKLHPFVVQECLVIDASCYLTGGFEDVLPDYVELAERAAGACRKRFYLVCPGCKAFREHLYLPPSPDPVWRCRKCHGLIYSCQRYGKPHPLRLTPPPRFYAKSIFGQALPPEYDVTPMLKARKKRRDGLPDFSVFQVLFQEFERNVYGIPVKRLA